MNALFRLLRQLPLKKTVLVTGLLTAVWLFYPSLGLGRYFHKENLVTRPRPTRILDRKGELLGELFYEKYGTLKYSDIPELMRNSLLFVEDRRFNLHPGIDPIAIARAFVSNLVSRSYGQGGSTITQQLARILLNDRTKSLQRKATEAVLAFIIEIKLTKEEILTEYMNRVYLGHGSYGFANAARFYFNKPLAELGAFECLLLASLPSAPNRYSPYKNVEASFGRTSVLVEAALDDDDLLSEEQKATLYKALSRFYGRINRSPTETVFGNFQSPYPSVSEYVRTLLLKKLGADRLYSGGYTVQTTIDRRLQKAVEEQTEQYIAERRKEVKPSLVIPEDEDAQKAVYEKLKKVRVKNAIRRNRDLVQLLSLFGGGNLDIYAREEALQSHSGVEYLPQKGLQAAMAGMKVGSGEILFLKGGVEFSAGNQFNRALYAYRQTGSSIKPVIYAAGISSGSIYTTTLLDDSPQFYENAVGENKDWLPENFDYAYKGKVSARDAMARSINIPAIMTAEKTGMDTLARIYRDLFFAGDDVFNRRFKRVLSIAIGSLEFSPLEMTRAYAAFAQRGSVYRPRLIMSIVDGDGNTVSSINESNFNRYPEKVQALDPGTSRIMLSMMDDSGRYSRVRKEGFKGHFVGKTGTTNNYKDAWFIGLTPQISAAVWVGFDNHAYGMGKAGTGSGMASSLWGRVMKEIYKDKPTGWFDADEDQTVKLRVCPESGLLAAESCKKTKKDLFLKSHRPSESCNINHSAETFADNSFNDEDFD